MDTGKLLVQGGLYAGIWQKIYELNVGDDVFTKLLMHFNGPNNATAIVDSGLNGYVVTKSGDATLTSLQSKVNRGSVALDGTGDYISVPDSSDWYFGTDPFTIDFWIYFNVVNVPFPVYSQMQTIGQDSHQVYWSANVMSVYITDSNTTRIGITVPFTAAINTWYHFALVRIDNGNAAESWRGFVNGVSQTLTLAAGAWNGNIANLSAAVDIGRSQHGGPTTYYANGYVDEYRVSKGIARWTANFTPQTTPYTADSQTVLLIHGEPHDTSAYLNIPTFVSGAKISKSPVYRLGTGALLLNGSSDCITFPDSADWQYGGGTGNFTIDCWIRLGSVSANQTVVGQRPSGGNYNSIDLNLASENRIYFNSYTAASANVSVYCSFAPTANIWYHIAIVRKGTTSADWLIFINGVSQAVTLYAGAYGATIPDFTTELAIGQFGFSGGNWFNGYVDEFRISDSARWTANFTPQSTAYTSDANTKLLVHFDGDYTDYSGSAHGNATLVSGAKETSLWKFGGGSVLLTSASSQYATIPDSEDWDFGTGDFTVDCWIKTNTLPGSGQQKDLFGHWAVDNGAYRCFLYNNTGTYVIWFGWRVSGSETHVEKTWSTPVPYRWYHLAVVRTSGSLRIFIDGSQLGTSDTLTDSLTMATTATLAVGWYGGGTEYWNGYIDELRISKGIARWTTTFVPPTSAYTADSTTMLLLHGDLNFKDTSLQSDHDLTAVGSAAVSGAQFKFGTGSLLLNGSTDWVTSPDSDDWMYGTRQFTIDCWVRFTTLPTNTNYSTLVSHWQGNALNQKGWTFLLYNNGGTYEWAWQASSDGSTSTDNIHFISSGVTTNVWYHVAITRDSTNLKVFQDGTQQGATTAYSTSIFNATALLGIGATNVSPGGTPDTKLTGYIDEVRISSTVRWTANFTPPTAAYTTDPSTVFLAHFDDLTDSSQLGHTVTPVAGASITANGVFSESSLLLNGSSDYLTIPDSNQWYFGTDDFTIDLWVRFSVISTQYYFVSQYSAGNNRWSVAIDSFNKLVLYGVAGGTTAGYYEMTSAWAGLATGTWYHLAFVRRGNNAYIFIDGVSQVLTINTAFSSNPFPNIANPLDVGQSNAGSYLNGNIDELRITKGKARWTASFTPPTAPYTDDTGKALTSVAITGLNGDTDVQYRIKAKLVSGVATTHLYARPNNDSGSNYGVQFLYGASTTTGALRQTANAQLYLTYGAAIDDVGFADMLLNAKSGYVRTAVGVQAQAIAGATITEIGSLGQSWNNTTDNITSLTLLADQTQGIGVGSSIELYARRG